MKILFDAHLSENCTSGIGRYIDQLIPAMLDQDQENEYLLLIRHDLDPNHPLKKLNSPNLKRIQTPLSGISLKQNYIIPQIINIHNPDIYHHPHFDLPFRVKVPSVATIHDVTYFQNPYYFTRWSIIKRFYMKLIFQHTLNHADKIITISNTTSNDLRQLFSVDKNKLVTIYHGIRPLEILSETNSDTMILESYSIKKPYLLYVGIRRPHKNLVNLIYAFNKIIEAGIKNIQLVIAGKKYNNYNLPEKIISSLGLEKQVLLLDYVEDRILKKLYQNAELFIFPSLYEGFGMPALESMQYDLPVLCSNQAALPEIVGNAGIFFNPTDPENISIKIMNLLKNGQIREKLIRRGRERLKSFSWKKTAFQTIDVYEKLRFSNLR